MRSRAAWVILSLVAVLGLLTSQHSRPGRHLTAARPQ